MHEVSTVVKFTEQSRVVVHRGYRKGQGELLLNGQFPVFKRKMFWRSGL